jgi:hypothetical protein
MEKYAMRRAARSTLATSGAEEGEVGKLMRRFDPLGKPERIQRCSSAE